MSFLRNNIKTRIHLVIIMLLVSFVMVSCAEKINDEQLTDINNSEQIPATDGNASEIIFDWTKGVKESEIFDYLKIPIEERGVISTVFDRGNTIYFESGNGSHKVEKKQIEGSQIYSGETLDRRFRMIHSFLYNDILRNEKINIEDKIDLKEYKGRDRSFSEYCGDKVLTLCQNISMIEEKSSWGANFQSAFPTYLYFDLQNDSYEFIKLYDILPKKDKHFSVNAVLIDKDKILISQVFEGEQCKALIYDLDLKKIIEEYELNYDYEISRGVGNCRVSPNGKYLLYEPLGKTRVALYLYDIENHKEHEIISQHGEEILSFYNWDFEDEFFYGSFNLETKGTNIYLKKAGDYK